MMRALEISHIVAGPTAGLIFSELGFEVIKIENPEKGDISRSLTGPSSGAFPFYNRSKKSITLNLKTEKGKEIFIRLLKQSDVIIDNLGYGALDRLGLGKDIIMNENPKIIYLSIKGYGPGPYQRRNSLDYPIEVESGIAYMTGLEGRPMRLGGSIVDIGAAMFGVIGVLSALIEREKTGKGKVIEIGLFETALFYMGQHIVTYQISQKPLKPLNEEGFAWAIYDFFDTKDNKKIFVAVATDNQWKSLCKIFDIPPCHSDDYATNKQRYTKRNVLISMLSEIIKQYDLDSLKNLFEKENISYAVLNRPWDLLNDIHAMRKMIDVKYEHRDLKMPASPIIKIDEVNDPPLLGQNNEEILKMLGYTDEEIKLFKEQNII